MMSDTLNRIEPPIADDGRIFSLFRDWQTAERAVSAMPGGDDASPEEAAFRAAVNHVEDILAEIAEVPAAGLPGFVLKAFLHIHAYQGGAVGPDPCVLSAAPVNESSEPGVLLMQSLLQDAACFTPELASLVERAISPMPEDRLAGRSMKSSG
jgi:hypothetical protein